MIIHENEKDATVHAFMDEQSLQTHDSYEDLVGTSWTADPRCRERRIRSVVAIG